VNVSDPVGAGFVQSLARPGGNATGFTSFDYDMGAKWLELLKQTAPDLTRVAIVRDPTTATGIGQASTIHCVDDEIMGWLQWREQPRRARAVMPPGNPRGD
jgi:putative tryptophan/tyrosine transport system substrate-binding protein